MADTVEGGIAKAINKSLEDALYHGNAKPAPKPNPAPPRDATAGERLRKAAKIYDERFALYGPNYLAFGDIMVALFPKYNIPAHEWNRIGLVTQMVTKLTRYGAQFSAKEPHADSLDDLAVYAMLLREVDGQP